MSTKSKKYNIDFYAWALHNATLLKQGKFSEVDVEHVAEEIESLGKSDKRELINRCAILLAHLLKWQFQPDKRSNSWKYTLEEQCDEILELLEDSPSLKYELEEKWERAYKKAVRIAVADTGMSQNSFPETCPFCLDDILNPDFHF
jgi:hypothetical protein